MTKTKKPKEYHHFLDLNADGENSPEKFIGVDIKNVATKGSVAEGHLACDCEGEMKQQYSCTSCGKIATRGEIEKRWIDWGDRKLFYLNEQLKSFMSRGKTDRITQKGMIPAHVFFENFTYLLDTRYGVKQLVRKDDDALARLYAQLTTSPNKDGSIGKVLICTNPDGEAVVVFPQAGFLAMTSLWSLDRILPSVMENMPISQEAERLAQKIQPWLIDKKDERMVQFLEEVANGTLPSPEQIEQEKKVTTVEIGGIEEL